MKVIYDLTDAGGSASTTAIAARLSVAPASVTGMLQKLSSTPQPLVSYHRHHGARLTHRGRLAALEIIRRHRLIETWLVRSLGYSWDAVHAEAEALEHVISADFERRISSALGNPTRDPHGDPIPSANLIMPEDSSIPLSGLHPAQDATVCRVEAREPELLRYLATVGIGIGARLSVLDVSRFDHVARLRVMGRREPVALGLGITSRVFVENVGGTHTAARRAVPKPEARR